MTVESLKNIWERDLLPSIKKEFKIEFDNIKGEITALNIKCADIERSQNYLSKDYDNFKESLQTVKKHVSETSQKIKNLEERLQTTEDNTYNQQVLVDNVQQYQRRDCIEITGVPVLPTDNPKQIVVEVGELMGIDVTEDHISTAHRLPSTKKVPNRIIAKFVYRDKKEEFYKRRRQFTGKKSIDIPCVANEYGESIYESNKIYINESLTPYRRKLFGKINEFKRTNKWKHIWSVINGKILLRQTGDSSVEFDQFLNK